MTPDQFQRSCTTAQSFTGIQVSSRGLKDEQRNEFPDEGVVVIRDFFDLETDIRPIHRAIYDVTGLVTRSSHLQATMILGRPGLAPNALPDNVRHMVVEINPCRTRKNIASIESWKSLDMEYIYL